MREGAGGITAYATDRDVTMAIFALAGNLFVSDLGNGRIEHLDVDGPVFDPHPTRRPADRVRARRASSG